MKPIISTLFAVLVFAGCGGGNSNRSPSIQTSLAAVTVIENTVATGYVASATDSPGEALTYIISGGNDAALFQECGA